MFHPYWQFTEGVFIPPDDAFENAATIMRLSIINEEVNALVSTLNRLGGTMLTSLNAATIMRSSHVNEVGTMSNSAINQTAELL